MSQSVTHIILQSRLRDVKVYPNTWYYKVFLPETIRNIVKVDLISAVIPVTITTINSTNSVIQYVDDSGITQTVQIPQGNYDLSLLIGALNDAVSGATFSIDDATGLVTISVDGSYNFLFETGDEASSSMHALLGFVNADTGPGSTFTATYKISGPPPAFVTVGVKELPQGLCKRMVRNLGAQSSQYRGRAEVTDEFCLSRIPLDVPSGSNKWYTAEDCELLPNRVSPFSLNGLTISIYDDFGRPYACGDENSFTLAIHTCSPPQMAGVCRNATSPLSLF